MILDTKRRQVETKGRTLRDLINTLNEIALGKLEKEVLAADHLDKKFMIFVNGNARDNLSTTLADGDDVLLFSVIDGG
jgi:molybdopterin converting factor small subunit